MKLLKTATTYDLDTCGLVRVYADRLKYTCSLLNTGLVDTSSTTLAKRVEQILPRLNQYVLNNQTTTI